MTAIMQIPWQPIAGRTLQRLYLWTGWDGQRAASVQSVPQVWRHKGGVLLPDGPAQRGWPAVLLPQVVSLPLPTGPYTWMHGHPVEHAEAEIMMVNCRV